MLSCEYCEIYENAYFVFTYECFPTWAKNMIRNIVIEGDIVSNFEKQNKKDHSKTQLDEKVLPFHEALDHSFFLYISTACLRWHLPYTMKDDSSEEI